MEVAVNVCDGFKVGALHSHNSTYECLVRVLVHHIALKLLGKCCRCEPIISSAVAAKAILLLHLVIIFFANFLRLQSYARNVATGLHDGFKALTKGLRKSYNLTYSFKFHNCFKFYNF